VVIPLPDGFTALERRDLFASQRSVLQQCGGNAPDLISHRMCPHQAISGIARLPDASADHDQIASAGEIPLRHFNIGPISAIGDWTAKVFFRRWPA
jgi:hypothetical protein